MDITIYTSDPDSIDTDEIAAAISAMGYLVGSVTVAV